MRGRGGKRFQAPVSLKSDDAATERVRRNHDERIRELQGVPVVGGKLIRDIELESGVETPIAHGLGRRAVVFTSPPRCDASRQILIGSAAMHPVVETSNWTPPSGSTDYWEMLDTTEALQVPLPVQVGDYITKLEVHVYSGATDPVVTLYETDEGESSGTAITPVTAWSAVPTTTWTVMSATYGSTVQENSHYYATVICTAIGDRVRMATVTVAGGSGTVREVRSSSYDPAKYTVLRADGWNGIATVDAWVF